MRAAGPIKMEKRLQIDFSDRAYKELEALQTRLDTTSKSEVVRDALGLLRWLVEEILDKNHRILVEKTEEGSTREVVFNFLERARVRHSDETSSAIVAR